MAYPRARERCFRLFLVGVALHLVGILRENDRLFIIALYVDERLIALFPHLISKRRLLFGGAVNVIRTVGSDHVSSDYLDFIIDPDHTDVAVNAWIEYLTAPGRDWALMEIWGIAREAEV